MTQYHEGMHEYPYDPLDCETCQDLDILAGIEAATREREEEEARQGRMELESGLSLDSKDGSTTICALLTGFIWLSAFGLELGGNRLTALFFFGLGLMFFGGTLALWAKSEEEK